MKKTLLFIINPIAGTRKKINLPNLIEQHIDQTIYSYRIELTKYAGHAREIAKKAVQNKVDSIIAVGGDGTVHEIAQELILTESALGIIPLGSGDGFAKSLMIPQQTIKALQALNKPHLRKLDVIACNESYFVGICGIGFDAFIAHQFAKRKKRGFLSYLNLTLKSYGKYQERLLKIKIDGATLEKKVFWMVIANTIQYGNDAFISPQSIPDDGQFEVLFFQRMPYYYLPYFIFALFTKRIKNNRFIEKITSNQIEIVDDQIFYHLDGEPYQAEKNLQCNLIAGALKLLVPHQKDNQ